MSRCYALTKEEKPCRGFGEILSRTDEEIIYSPTCKKHSGYEFKKILVTNAQSLEWDSIYYNYYKRVLEDGVLEITKQDIEELPQGNYTHFLFLCAKYVPGFHFNWNRKRSLATLANLSWQRRSVGPVYVSKDDVILFASTIGSPVATLLYCLSYYPSKTYSQPDKEEWIRFIDHFFETDIGKRALGIPSLLTLHTYIEEICKKTQGTVMLELLDSIFQEYVKDKKKKFYLSFKDRTNTFKEELVKVTWHPNRFINWCLDLDGVEFFTG